MKQLTVPLALCAVLLTTTGVVACGGESGGVPDDAIATVDGVAIDRSAYDHWLAIKAKAEGGESKAVREQVVQQLVHSAWIEGEAEDRGVAVDEAAVRADFERQKQLSFPREAEFAHYLKSSGQSEADVLERVRMDLLSNRIREAAAGDEPKVGEEQVAEHYERNKASFAQPERRDVNVVLTETRAEAEAARAELEAGASWAAVARSHSIDKASRAAGGKLTAVARAEHDDQLGQAIFEAPRGELTGPVKARHGYWVLEVTRVVREELQSLEEARPAIEQLLMSEARRKQHEQFTDEFRDKWRSRTECGKGYVTPDCSNGPDIRPKS
jgi:foldase protein PrsA